MIFFTGITLSILDSQVQAEGTLQKLKPQSIKMFSTPIAPQDSLHPLSHPLPFLFLLSEMQLHFKPTHSCSNYS